MPRNTQRGGLCSFFAVIIGFGFFSILWDLASKAWGLGHGTVLIIFLVAAIVVGAIVEAAVKRVQARSVRRGRGR